MNGPMRVVFNKPSRDGLVRTQGTEIITPDGSKVTGVVSIEMRAVAGTDLVETVVVLHNVIVEYGQE
jgi:hypothetical protein